MKQIKKFLQKNILRIWAFNSLLFRYPYNLDIHICEHCNLNCKGCNHYSPLAKPSFCNIDSLKKNLNTLKTRGGVDKLFKSIYLVGGEPLLNPEITEIFRITREFFPKSTIKVVTNGICLSRNSKPMPESFWEACRKYSISFDVSRYPINIDYKYVVNLLKENNVKFNFFWERNDFYSFRLTKNTNDKNRFNFYNCVLCRCLQLVGDRIYPCPISAYVNYLNESFKTDFKHKDCDYLTLSNISRWKLRLFRLRAKPFCKYCVFPRSQVKWETSALKYDEWISVE